MAESLRMDEIRRRDVALDLKAGPGHPASLLKPGTMSATNIAVAGSDGYLFIGDGANHWERQYLGELKIDSSWFDSWMTVLRTRQAEASARGVVLVNFVAPEKQIVYPEKRWAESVPDGGRRPLKQLLERLDPQVGLIYPEAALLAAKAETPMYFRHNSHWTPSGCCAALAPLLASLGVEADLESVAFSYEASVAAHDLTVHYFEPPPEEEVGWLKPAGQVVFDNRHIELTGKHAGSRYAINNPQAPDRRRVLVFGDSYAFDVGLTYALSAVFAEVAFVWSKAVIWELAEQYRAEIVVWESAERFLATLPAA